MAWVLMAALVHAADALPQAPAPETAPTGDDEKAWYQRMRMAPVAVTGNVGYELRAQDGDLLDRTMSHLLYARVDAASFLWQPWFATVSGGLGVTAAWTGLPAAWAGDTGVDTPQGYTRDLYVTGNAQINLFPRSRFPFEAHLEVSDTRAAGGLAALPPARWTRVGLSQAWRPTGEPYSLYGGFDHATQQSSLGTDTQDTLYANGDLRWKDNALSATLNYNRNSRGRTGEDAEFGGVYARHSYQPSPAFSVETTANLTRNAYSLLAGSSETGILQATSIAYWRPLERPYTLTATLRALGTEVNGQGAKTAYATLGGTYDFSPNLRATANLGAGTVEVPGGTQYLYASTAGVTYQGATLPLGPLTYDWSTSANLSWAGAGGSRARVEDPYALQRSVGLASASFAQRLARTWTLAGGASVSAALAQDLGAGRTTAARREFEDVSRLNTTASLAWSSGAGRLNGYASLQLTDARDLVVRDNTFQMANLQVSGTWDLGRYSQLAGNLTAQWVSTQSAPRDPLAPAGFGLPAMKQVSTGLGADILYRHDRVFGVPRLRFVSELRATDQSIVEQDQAALLPDRETRSWENRLEYSIGLLRVTAGIRISEVNGDRVRVAGLRIQRDFASVMGQ